MADCMKISMVAVGSLTMVLLLTVSILPAFLTYRTYIPFPVDIEDGIWKTCAKSESTYQTYTYARVCRDYSDLTTPDEKQGLVPQGVHTAQACNIIALLSFAVAILVSLVIQRWTVPRVVHFVPRVLALVTAVSLIVLIGVMVHGTKKSISPIKPKAGAGVVLAGISVLTAIGSAVLAHFTHNRVSTGLYQSL
ncbi:uncharacterized protein LOC135826058 [Sycon ciliatum]|uniref:uncharacterized protein LOC135826058 n=1 Tax=Sycon ciliatum TaxID=27933 RepID=UPI0020AEC393|eukprot:scpid90416/ scgid25577/ 